MPEENSQAFEMLRFLVSFVSCSCSVGMKALVLLRPCLGGFLPAAHPESRCECARGAASCHLRPWSGHVSSTVMRSVFFLFTGSAAGGAEPPRGDNGSIEEERVEVSGCGPKSPQICTPRVLS